MTKINYTVGEGNIITSWTEIPFKETMPWIEVEDPHEVHPGFDKIIDGVLVPDPQGYEAYMEAQAIRRAKLARIEELKANLAATDYQAIKHSEGLITEEEYAPIKARRQAWRDEINELEEELAA